MNLYPSDGIFNLHQRTIMDFFLEEPVEGKQIRDSCSWNLSKCKTISPANQIARNKHNEELELLRAICFNTYGV